MPQIFISYRRGDTKDIAGHLWERLAQRYGRDKIFWDLKSNEFGDEFTQRIQAELRSSNIVIVLIGRDWATQKSKQPGLWDENNLARKEVEAALSLGERLAIIPVLVGGAVMPTKLPAGIEQIAKRHAASLNTEEFDHQFKLLCRRIDALDTGVFERRPAGHDQSPFVVPYPRSLADKFCGRDGFMKILDADFAERNVHVIVAIRALGGSGKTRLASEYAHTRRLRYRDGIVSVRADSPMDLYANVERLAMDETLAWRTMDNEDAAERLFLRWLNSSSEKLLIIDNVDDGAAANAVVKFISRIKSGHILITGRYRNWEPPIIARDLKNELEPADAEQLLLRTTTNRRRTDADERAARELAIRLRYVPIALAQAAADINVERTTLSAYLDFWKQNRRKARIESIAPETYDRALAVATTLHTSFLRLNPSALRLLKILAWLSSARIYLWMVDQIDGDLDIVSSRDTDDLKSYMLINDSESDLFFTTVPVVQETMRDMMLEESQDAASSHLSIAARWIVSGFEQNAEAYLPHLVNVLYHLNDPEFRSLSDSDIIDKMTRLVVFNLPKSGLHNHDPDLLPNVLGNFYEVAPFMPVLYQLVGTRPQDRWLTQQRKLLDTNNLVLRHAMAESIGHQWSLPDIRQGFLKSADLFEFELFAGALISKYAEEPETIEAPLLERLIDEPVYSGCAILSHLFLNLAPHCDVEEWIGSDNKRFWESRWDMISTEVAWIRALRGFSRGERPSGEDAQAAYDELDAVRREISNLRERKLSPAIDSLLRSYHEDLGANATRLEDAKEAFDVLRHDRLRPLIRIFLAHPLWAVQEAAATLLYQLAMAHHGRVREERIGIIQELFEDPSWRVRYGAVEAAFAVRYDSRGTYELSVAKFYNDDNARVRGLCAENLVPVILNANYEHQAELLTRFNFALHHWAKDKDCFVLDHQHRLYHALHMRAQQHSRQPAVSSFVPKIVSELFESQNDDWYIMSRPEFLRLIEEKKYQT
jgi:hypothetical protein